LSPIPVESKPRPMVGMRELTFLRANQLELRRLEGLILRLALVEVGIETLHEQRRRGVGDAPQRGDDRARASELEGAHQPDQALPSQLLAEPRIAGRESDQIR